MDMAGWYGPPLCAPTQPAPPISPADSAILTAVGGATCRPPRVPSGALSHRQGAARGSRLRNAAAGPTAAGITRCAAGPAPSRSQDRRRSCRAATLSTRRRMNATQG